MLVFALSLAAYLVTLSPSIFDGVDNIEFVVMAHQLGVAHAPGYPLYLLLGKLFTYIPLGDVAYRVNLLSAVCAAATAALVCHIIWLLTRQRGVAVAAALFFAFSYYQWTLAVVAEVYSLHALATALIVWLWFRWEQAGKPWMLYTAAAVWGLSMGNHLTIGLLAPAFVFIVLLGLRRRVLRWRDPPLLAAVFLVCGALIYSYLPARYLAGAPTVLGVVDGWGSFQGVNLTTPSGLWWTLSGKEYDSLMFAYDFRGFLGQLAQYGKLLAGNFLAIGLAFGGIGLLWSAWKRPVQFMILALVFAGNALFFANYGAWDKDTMFLPTYVIWAVWVGLGLGFMVRAVQNHAPAEGSQWRRQAERQLAKLPWGAAALALPVAAFVINFSYADASSTGDFRAEYRAFLNSLEPNSIVLAWYLDVWPFKYFQYVDGDRPDVLVIDRVRITRLAEAQLIERFSGERPIYIFSPLPPVRFPHRVEDVWQGNRERAFRIYPLQAPVKP